MSTIVDLDGDGLIRCLHTSYWSPEITTTIGELRDYWGSNPDKWGMLGSPECSDAETIRCDLRAVWEDAWEGEIERVEVWFERCESPSEPWYVCIDRPHKIIDIPPEEVCEHASSLEKARMFRRVSGDGPSWIVSDWIDVLTSADHAHALPAAFWREVWGWARANDAESLSSLLKTPTVLEMLNLTSETLVDLLSDDRPKVRQAAFQALGHVTRLRSSDVSEPTARGAR